MMRNDNVSDEVAFNSISGAFQQPSESRGKFMAKAVAVALAVLVFRFRPKCVLA